MTLLVADTFLYEFFFFAKVYILNLFKKNKIKLKYTGFLEDLIIIIRVTKLWNIMHLHKHICMCTFTHVYKESIFVGGYKDGYKPRKMK